MAHMYMFESESVLSLPTMFCLSSHGDNVSVVQNNGGIMSQANYPKRTKNSPPLLDNGISFTK